MKITSRKILSLILAVCLLLSCIYFAPITGKAANTLFTGKSPQTVIEGDDYLYTFTFPSGVNWTNASAWTGGQTFPRVGNGAIRSYAFKFKVLELAAGEELMFGLCWSADMAAGINGVLFRVRSESASEHTLTVEKQSGVVVDGGTKSIPSDTEYKLNIFISGTDGLNNEISVYLNDELFTTFIRDVSMLTAASRGCMMLVGCGGGAGVGGAGTSVRKMQIDASPDIGTSKTVLTELYNKAKVLNDATGVSDTGEYGKVPTADKNNFEAALSAAKVVLDKETSTSVEVTKACYDINEAYMVFARKIVLPPDKTALIALFGSAQALYNSVSVGDALGQVPDQAYKTALKEVIDAANLVIDSNSSTTQEITAVQAALTKAVADFNAKINKMGDPSALLADLATARTLLARLIVNDPYYKSLNSIIISCQAKADNLETLQGALDEARNELNSLVSTITMSVNASQWTTSVTDPNISIRYDDSKVEFETKHGARDWDNINIYKNMRRLENNGDKIVFNLKALKRTTGGIWQRIALCSTAAPNILYQPAICITIADNGEGEIGWRDGSGDVVQGRFGYSLNQDIQISFVLETDGNTSKIVVLVGGVEMCEIANSTYVNILKSTYRMMYSGNFGGGSLDGDAMITQINFKPAVILGYGPGDFSPAAQNGGGSSDFVQTAKDGDVQNITIFDGGSHEICMARTTLLGPLNALEFSFKATECEDINWFSLLFSEKINYQALQTPGVKITFGGDRSVIVSEHGSDGTALWSFSDFGFFKLNKKMRFKLYIDTADSNKLVVIMNDKEIRRDVTAQTVELFNLAKSQLSLFGGGLLDSSYIISYLNKADPEPYDDLNVIDFPDTIPDLISLDEGLIDIKGHVIYPKSSMTIGEFADLIYLEPGFSVKFYGADGKEITDSSKAISEASTVKMFFDTIEVETYTLDASGLSSNNADQSDKKSDSSNTNSNNSGNSDGGYYPSPPDTDTDIIDNEFELTEEILLNAILNSQGDLLKYETKTPGILTVAMQQLLKDNGKSLRYDILDENGDILVIWVFENLNNIQDDIDLGVSFTTRQDNNVKRLIGDGQKTIIVGFNHSGALPGNTSVYVRNTNMVFAFGTPSFGQSDKPLLYLLNVDDRKLDLSTSDVGFTEDRELVGFSIDHCSIYTVTTYTMEQTETDTPAEDAATGSSRLWLYILIPAAGVVLLAGAITLTLVIVKKRKKFRSV